MPARSGLGGRLLEFVREVYDRSGDDDVFFLASGLTFCLLLAAGPFLLLLLSAAGAFLASPFHLPQSEILNRFWQLFPVTDPEVREALQRQLRRLIASAGPVTVVSGVLFVWFSTRLFGALRTALAEVFDLRSRRGIVWGKVVDVEMVLISTVLLTVNIALTSAIGGLGLQVLTHLGMRPGIPERLVGLLTAFFFIYVMFLLIYKFVPARQLSWRTASVAALFAAAGFELLKWGFGWYVTNYADFSRVFFTLTTVVVVVITLYYGAILFLLGGEVAQVYQMRRTMRAQRETFEDDPRTARGAGGHT